MGQPCEVLVRLRVPSCHSMQIPDGLEVLIAKLLKAAGKEGEFKARLGPNIRGTPFTKGISIVPMNNRNTAVQLKAQPGKNGTRHVVYLQIPRDEVPEEFLEALLEAVRLVNQDLK